MGEGSNRSGVWHSGAAEKHRAKRRTIKWKNYGTALKLHFLCIPKSQCLPVTGKRKICAILCAFPPSIGVIIGGVVWLWGFYGRYLTESRGFYAMIFVMIPVFLTGGIHLDACWTLQTPFIPISQENVSWKF